MIHHHHQNGHHHHEQHHHAHHHHHHHGHHHHDTFVSGGIELGYRHYGRVLTHPPSCAAVCLIAFGVVLVSAGIVMICVMDGGGYITGIVVTFFGLLLFFAGLLVENASRRKREAAGGSLITTDSTPAPPRYGTTTTSCQLQVTAGPEHPPGYQSTLPPSYESLHSQFPSAGTQCLPAIHASDCKS